MKTLVIDLDGTLTIDEENVAYKDKKPNLALIKRLKIYQKMGFVIRVFTSRNMRTFNGDIEKIRAQTLPQIIAWLEAHKVPFDEVIVGKTWCDEGFYVDDKAIRPSEFILKSRTEIKKILKNEALFNLAQNSKISPTKKSKSKKLTPKSAKNSQKKREKL